MRSKEKTHRRRPIAIANLVRCALALAVVLAGKTSLAADLSPKIVEEAAKEGKVVFYTAMTLSDSTRLSRAFEAKYPNIKVELYRFQSRALMTRVVQEDRAKKSVFDVINLNIQAMNTFKGMGILGKYVSPERKEYPEVFKEHEGYWTGIYYNIFVIVYNRKLVSSSDAPKSYEDLANPKWRGKIMNNSQEPEWFMFMLDQLGREKGLSLMRRITANNMVYRAGSNLVLTLIAAGEAAIGFPVHGYAVEAMKQRDAAPLDWTRPEPVFFSQVAMGISSKSLRPHAAKLFLDFALSKAGQEAIGEEFRIPVHPGVRQKAPRLTEGLVYPKIKDYFDEEYNELNKLYREIFRK